PTPTGVAAGAGTEPAAGYEAASVAGSNSASEPLPSDFAKVTHSVLTRTPTTMARTYSAGLPIRPTTQMPPCGAREVAPKPSDIAPVTAEPAIREGMTRTGSAAANGIAPSVMKEAPSSHAASPACRSDLVNSLGRTTVASAMASG